MDNLVERLRKNCFLKATHPHLGNIADDCMEAADRIRELEAQLKDRHKRLNKAHDRNADLLEAVEDMDYVKAIRAKHATLITELREMAEKWRYEDTTYYNEVTQCADELTALLDKEQSDE